MAGYSVTYSVVDEATAKIDAINRRIQQLRAPLDRQARSMQKFMDVSGLQKVADGFGGIARNALSAFESVSRLIPALGAITGAASIAGMARMVSLFSDMSAELSHTATGLNVSSQRLQEYQNAIRLAGGSVDDMTEGLKGLARASYEAILGRDPIAAQTFARAGIALKDANGQLRDATELLPEAVQYVGGFANAQDRAAIATQLGSRRIADLAEDFRRSGKPFNEWLKLSREQGTISKLTQEQLLKYRMALGQLSVAFEQLGYDVSGVIGGTVAPMLTDLGKWVQAHQKDIHDFVYGFAEGIKQWYQGGGVSRLLGYLESAGKILKTIADNADIIAAIFITKWGIQGVAAIANLVTAFGTVGTGLLGAGGSGLLGVLGVAAALAGAVWWASKNNPGPKLPDTPGGMTFDPNSGLMVPNMPGGRPAPGGTRVPGRGYGFATHAAAATAAPQTHGRGSAPAGALPQAAQEAISRAEGTYGAGGIDWNVQSGERPGQTSKNLTDMTIAQVAQERGPDFGGLQINRVHLRPGSEALRALGIDPTTTKFTPDVQQRIAGFVHGQQGLGAWRGFIQHPEELQRAQQAIDAAPRASAAPAAGGSRSDKDGAYGVPGAVMNYGNTGALGPPGTNLTTIRTPSGKTATVNAAAADAFSGFLSDLEKTGYKIRSLGGYSNRGKAGGSGLSEHAFGTAIDINPDANPFRSDRTDLPANIHDMAAKWGLVWGGDWTSPKDTMHFQWGGSKPWMMAKGQEQRPAAQGAPQQIEGAGKPANGEVNVTVTHKNPPAGASASATGKGEGVNVGPVRTEWSDLSAI